MLRSPEKILPENHEVLCLFQMLKKSWRLVQHDFITLNMCAAHNAAQHTFRLAYSKEGGASVCQSALTIAQFGYCKKSEKIGLHEEGEMFLVKFSFLFK